MCQRSEQARSKERAKEETKFGVCMYVRENLETSYGEYWPGLKCFSECGENRELRFFEN